MNASPPARRTAWAAGVLLFAIAVAVALVLRGPEPLPPDAPLDRVSAGRALQELQRVLPTEIPRPIGSTEHGATRERIAARFRELGYDVTIQSTFVCDARIECAPVQNILARRPGDPAVPGVVVATHYDGVAAGPSVSDAGVGVAVALETARALFTTKTARPISFLVTDGEESGLFGARAFVADPTARNLADVIVNVENRGSSGPAFMFETSRSNYGLVEQYARGAKNPVSSSLFVSIYEALPNDTDLSVFKRAGLRGVNFAAIRDPYGYHTPLDAQRRVNPRTVQHYVDSVAGTAGRLATMPSVHSQHAVHFDVLSVFVARWPQRFSLPFSVTLLLISLVFCVIRRRALAMALLYIPASLLAVTVGALLLGAIGTIRTASVPWLASPQLLLAAMWIVAISLPILVAAAMQGRVSEAAMLTASSLWWSAFSVATSIALPGGSYLFIIPAAALAVATAAAQKNHEAARLLTLASLIAGATLWLPFAFVLYEALGAKGLASTALVIFFVVAPVVPWLADATRNAARVALAAAFVAAFITAVLPATSAWRPRPLNLLLYAEEGYATRWLASAMTRELKNAATFDNRKRPILPWSDRTRGYVADANEFRFPAPSVEVKRLATGTSITRTYTIHSVRQALTTQLSFRTPARITSLRVNGVSASVTDLRQGSWNRVVVRAPSAVIEIATDSLQPIEAYASDRVYGLPAEAKPVLERRDAGGAVPFGEGDVSIAARRVPE